MKVFTRRLRKALKNAKSNGKDVGMICAHYGISSKTLWRISKGQTRNFQPRIIAILELIIEEEGMCK